MRRRRFVVAALSSAVVAAGAALAVRPGRAVAQRRHVDGVAAIIGAHSPRAGATVLTWSDVALDAALERLRSGRADGSSPTVADLEAARERLIQQVLIVREAARLRLDELDEAKSSEAWRRFFELHGGARGVEALSVRLDLADDELDTYVRWEGIVRDFLLRSSATGAVVSEADVEDAYAAGEHPFVGVELETVREPLRVWLLDQRVAEERALVLERLAGRVPIVRRRVPS